MSPFNSSLIIVMAFLAVFFQASYMGLRGLMGFQVDLLTPLVIYASLTTGLPTITLVAGLGGLWLDSLSANPLGVSVLPLYLAGIAIHQYRNLILRTQFYAQMFLGLGGCALVPLMTYFIIRSLGEIPVIGWGTFWQWIMVSLSGALLTPGCFLLFNKLHVALNYQPLQEMVFRSDREIKRGR